MNSFEPLLKAVIEYHPYNIYHIVSNLITIYSIKLKRINKINKMSYEYEKYICSPEKVKEWVDQYGVAVVKGVLDKDEIKDMRDGMWSYLEHTTQRFEKPIKKDDPSSWVEYQKLYP